MPLPPIAQLPGWCESGMNPFLWVLVRVEKLRTIYYGIIYILFILNKWKVTTAGCRTILNQPTRDPNTAQPASAGVSSTTASTTGTNCNPTLRQTGPTLWSGPGSFPPTTHWRPKSATTPSPTRQCGSNQCHPGPAESPSKYQAPIGPIWFLPKLGALPWNCSSPAQPATFIKSTTCRGIAPNSTLPPRPRTCTRKVH